MKLGLIANTTKKEICEQLPDIMATLRKKSFEYILDSSLKNFLPDIPGEYFCKEEELGSRSDILVAIGGDGTVLSAALIGHTHDKPLVGINFGKLGFLADVDIKSLDSFLLELKEGKYFIEERMVLQADSSKEDRLLGVAFNDFVIDKGSWTKMIDLELYVDEEYVTTFPADGVVFATPTGSTGYSLSAGGPIVTPKAEVIAISPISPHSLTTRPLILSPKQKVTVKAYSQFNTIQFNADGQRVEEMASPLEVCISKCEKSLKILRTHSSSYFEVLKNKLLWGIDLRNNQLKNKRES